MSNIKCPFCNLDIRTHRIFTDGCDNTHSLLWQELIRTRKALEVAKDALNIIKGKHDPRCAVYHIDEKTAYDALEQITALEQKDVK